MRQMESVMLHTILMIVLMAIGIHLGILFLLHIAPKAIGLCFVIVGSIFCMGGIGMLIGIPMILIGGAILFA
jgi:hypothetical protein